MKKSLFVAIILFVFSFVKGQDTTYYNSSGDTVNFFSEAHYYGVIRIDSSGHSRITEELFYKNGNLKSSTQYSNTEKKIQNGNEKTWSENGVLLSEINYNSNKLNGTLKTWWKNGVQKRNDLYINDSLISGKCFDSTGKEIPHFAFMISPEFPGGLKEMYTFIITNLDYPEDAKEKGIQGKVYVSFVIEKDGNVSNVKVVTSIHPLLDEEAIRVVSTFPQWKPGLRDGEPIKTRYKLPVFFKYEVKNEYDSKEKKKKKKSDR